ERFRRHASAKLARIEKLDRKAITVDVEICAERNPRQSDRRERVELTIRSRGPVIRAEAAADDRYAALARALAQLETRLRWSGGGGPGQERAGGAGGRWCHRSSAGARGCRPARRAGFRARHRREPAGSCSRPAAGPG